MIVYVENRIFKKKLELVSEFSILYIIQTIESLGINLTKACKIGIPKTIMAQTVKHLSTMQKTWVRSLGWEDPMEKEMATHSSVLARKMLWTEKLGLWCCKESDRTEATEQCVTDSEH